MNDAAALLNSVDALLDAPVGTTKGNSARLAAVLTRQAVEDLIDARCAELCGVAEVTGSWRAKLAVLKSLDAAPSGRVLVDAWHQLTTFCHHHAYEMSPTIAEVRALSDAVRQCIRHSREGA